MKRPLQFDVRLICPDCRGLLVPLELVWRPGGVCVAVVLCRTCQVIGEVSPERAKGAS